MWNDVWHFRGGSTGFGYVRLIYTFHDMSCGFYRPLTPCICKANPWSNPVWNMCNCTLSTCSFSSQSVHWPSITKLWPGEPPPLRLEANQRPWHLPQERFASSPRHGWYIWRSLNGPKWDPGVRASSDHLAPLWSGLWVSVHTQLAASSPVIG